MSLRVPSLTALCAILLAAAPAFAGEKTWETDGAHTMIGFRAGTFLFDVPGKFEKYSVAITGDPAKPSAKSVRVEIDAATISTGIQKRDDHLRTDDFFDVKKFPKIIFEGKSVRKSGNKTVVDGTLEMHGVKKPLSISFDSVTAKNGAGYEETVYKGSAVISNKDYGLGAKSVAAKISLKDEVTLDIIMAGFWNDPAAKKK